MSDPQLAYARTMADLDELPDPAADASDIAPRRIADRYRIGRFLGAGGFGTVYEALDERIEKTVAVKLLGTHRATQSKQVLERFRTEALAASRLNHPNIVGVTDFDVLADGRAYLVMEYVSGETLASYIGNRAPLDPRRAVRIATALCEALAEAHGAGVVHRDLKPANVIVGDSNSSHLTVKILDFGVAKIAQGRLAPSQSRAGNLLGTPQYIAPEQIRKGASSVDGRSDIYSVGMVLYEMLTGQLPFSSRNLADLLRAQVKQPPTPPSELRADIPAALEAIVLKALEKDPDDRYATATEMAEALEAFLVAPARSSRRSSRWVAAAGAVIAAAAIALAPAAAGMSRGPSPQILDPDALSPVAPASRPASKVVRVEVAPAEMPAKRAKPARPRKRPARQGRSDTTYRGPDSPLTTLGRSRR